jgi:type IVB pilus formation R64 PilN family outer membrane protein
MRNKYLLKIAIATAILPFTLAGCATFHQAHVKQVQAEQAITRYQPPKAPPVVSTVDTPYLLGTVVDVRHTVPAILKQSITLIYTYPMTLRQIAGEITQKKGIPVHIEDSQEPYTSAAPGGMLPPLPSQTGGFPTPLQGAGGQSGYASRGIPLDWHGSVAGLLDMITARNGVWWRYRDGAVRIFRTETKTFSIPALAWSTESSGSIVASAGANAMGGGMSSGIGGAGSMPTGGSMGASGASGGQGNESTGATSIVNTSKIDVWAGLQKIAQTVAGSGAQVEADGSTSTITVTGTPPQIRHVREWVHGLSRQLERQVAITVHVYNVTVNNEQNYGLNLAGAFQSLGKQYGVSLQGVAPPTPTGGTQPMSIGANILNSATGAMGQWQGSSVAVQALATLGHVSQVFSKSTISLNGQPAPIQVAQQTVYLAESSSTQTANVGATNGLIPGTVTTGFTAMFLPRIIDGKILLGMNMTISNLVSIQTISSGGNSIQAPTVDNSTFQQSVKLKPGQTLLLTGYSQKGGSTTRNGVGSPYLPLLGGGADANTSKQMIAIVITARIL